MCLLFTIQANLDIRTTIQNPSRRLLSASRARNSPLFRLASKDEERSCDEIDKLHFIETIKLHSTSRRGSLYLHTVVILCLYCPR